jgi:hypothetical protein
MPEIVAPPSVAPRSTTWLLVLVAALLTLALLGTIILWAHYGTTVFFETIRAGFAACFG